MDDNAGRRQFLRGAAGAATLATAGCLGSLNRPVRVPALRSGGRVDTYQRVPRSWRRHVEAVTSARQTLDELASEIDEISVVKVVPSDVTYGGRTGLELVVELGKPDAGTAIPEAIEDIPVRTTEVLERGLSACYNADQYDPVPGGVVVEPEEGETFGTACCRVFQDGAKRLLTAAHLWQSCDGGAALVSRVDQGGRHLGHIERYHDSLDVAVVETESGGVDLADTIKLETDTRRPVSGVVTRWGIALLLTGGGVVQNIGTASGLTEGKLTAMNVRDGWDQCVDFGGHGIEAEYLNVEGDSGGPVFFVDDRERFFMVGLQQMWVSKVGTGCQSNVAGDRGRGTAAHYLANELDFRFSGSEQST